MSDGSMDDPFTNDDGQVPSAPAPADPPAIPPPAWRLENPVEYFERRRSVSAWQRSMLRRLAALLCTGTLAFTLTTWVLVQRERHAPAALAVGPGERAERGDPGSAASAAGGEPAQTARAQLQALNRGDVRTAYEMFSPDYRNRVPLEAFKKLVALHRDMFRTEEEGLDTVAVAPDRVRIDLHVQSQDDEQYIAHFTMARVNGRWFVDDLRWVNAEDEDDGLTSA